MNERRQSMPQPSSDRSALAMGGKYLSQCSGSLQCVSAIQSQGEGCVLKSAQAQVLHDVCAPHAIEAKFSPAQCLPSPPSSAPV